MTINFNSLLQGMASSASGSTSGSQQGSGGSATAGAKGAGQSAGDSAVAEQRAMMEESMRLNTAMGWLQMAMGIINKISGR